MIYDLDNNRDLTQDDCRSVEGINRDDIGLIEAYLQGCVYCWCIRGKNSNRENEWFRASDFLGGENYFWERTPMVILYNYYLANSTMQTMHIRKSVKRAVGC